MDQINASDSLYFRPKVLHTVLSKGGHTYVSIPGLAQSAQGKGTSVKRVGNSHYLYKTTSKRVPLDNKVILEKVADI